jgi:hypothetical protein
MCDAFHHLQHLRGLRCAKREELRLAAGLRRVNPVEYERMEM